MSVKNKTNDGRLKIPVIVGPTGSGKTGLAIKLALELKNRGIFDECEIISADSRAIYKGMDIGTAKPTPEEMQGVQHWGIDLVGPGERFTVADFKAYAEQKISEILERGHLPIIVGGTGLYVDALIFNYSFSEKAKKSYSDREQMCEQYIVVSVQWPREQLRERLMDRSRKLFDAPIEEEYKKVAAMYAADSQAMKSDIYPIVGRMLAGEISREEAIAENALVDWHLAKRQLTWFRRNPRIKWLSLDDANDYFLSELC